MTRGSFLKSLAALFIAPKVLSEIKIESARIASASCINRNAITDLNFVVPDYYESVMKKYATGNFSMYPRFLEKNNIEDAKQII